ncbi:MAG: DUF4349 domain-containing protein [Candidatus Limnocylindria bacterium]|nr:DUF4349 domain-containing protein [Candidatus Limnocylindria bacterium]
MTRSRVLITLALSALLLAACSATTAPTGAPAPAGGFGVADAARGAPPVPFGGAPAPEKGALAATGSVTAPAQNGAGQPIPVPRAFDTDRSLILTANVALRAKDPWAISDRAQAIATGLGGDVMGLAQSGSGDRRSATLTLRVPAARFNDALRQLRDLDAEVVSSSVDGKDVTDQFVDLQARLRAKQAEEQRYLVLLARAEKIDDILKLDSVLAQTRTQIEQLTGQINSIKSRTEFSTIIVTIATAAVAPPPVPAAGWDPAQSAALALAALTALLRVAADLAIWTLVLGTLPAIAGLALWVAVRGRRRAATPTA